MSIIKVGITQRVDTIEAYNEKRDSLDQRWQFFCKAINVLCVPIPNCCLDPENFCNELCLSGFIFSGGNETDERDLLEKKILTYALENKLPILGVCKGMQFITKFFGGQLCEVRGHVKTSHIIRIMQNNFGLTPGLRNINSFHRYAVETLPNDFLLIAKDEKNYCEAMEHKTNPIFACMWHPERDKPFSPEMTTLLEKFFKYGK